MAEKKALTFKSHLGSGIYIEGNPDLLKRAFINLIDNAIKYTEAPGEILVTLSATPKFAYVVINDTGIGIAPEHIPLMFDRFWRATSCRSPRPQGTGLGLAIVQSIIQSHRGQIHVKSQVGQGTTITVKLPLTANS